MQNNLNHGKLTPRVRRLLRVALLLPVFVAIYALAYSLRYDGHFSPIQWENLVQTMVCVVAIKLVAFGHFRFYQGWQRYLTFDDLLALGKAASASSIIMALADYLLLPSLSIPRSIFLMDWGATIIAIGGLRVGFRLARQWMDHLGGASDRVIALIVGANDSGEALLRAINRPNTLSYRVVGFIDDAQSPGIRIGGVPVLGELRDIESIVAAQAVKEVLVSSDSISSRQLRALVADGRQLGFRVKIVPSYEQLLDQRVEIQPRSVAIEDLLRREPVRLDMHNIQDWIDGRVLMVTGSAGSIGSEICRQLLQFRPAQIVLVDRSESGQFFLERELQALAPEQNIEVCMADITDASRIETLLRRYRPDIIFHAAAYKHVPLMETNPGEAVKNIVLATRTLAELAELYGVGSLVMISTDKAVNPSSVMGACKRLAEMVVQALAEGSKCRFVTVRFGNVLDSAGSVVPIFRNQIAGGGPVTVTHPDMTRYFMTIPEASQLVIQAGAMGEGGEIFVLDMGEAVRIVDLAADMIRLSGLRVGDDIEIEFTGLRPGEKLVEELFDHREHHAFTRHEKIMVAEGRRIEIEQVQRAIQYLAGVIESPTPVVVEEMQEQVNPFHQLPPSKARGSRRAA